MTIPQNVDLALKVGIAHGGLDHKAVHLGAGQHLGTGRTHRVLGGQNHKGIGQIIGLTVHGDTSFFHSLQQGRLGLAGGAVDFIGQQQVGHNCTGFEDELLGLLIVDGVADDIRRHRIGGELDTLGVQTQNFGKGHGCGGLADTGYVLHEDMTRCQNRHQNSFYNFVFTNDNFFDFLQNLLDFLVHVVSSVSLGSSGVSGSGPSPPGSSSSSSSLPGLRSDTGAGGTT